jgi:hypothetical protein
MLVSSSHFSDAWDIAAACDAVPYLLQRHDEILVIFHNLHVMNLLLCYLQQTGVQCHH